jgi:hypothetical protein
MLLRWRRLLQRTAFEWLAAAVGAFTVGSLLRDDEPVWALALGGGFALAVGVGLWLHARSGDLRLAWRFPRLDRLGLRAASQDAPWHVLHAAEAAIATLEQDAAAFGAFFHGAQRDILASTRRTLDLHRFRRKTEHALVDAPAGEAKMQLEAQCARATAELEQVHTLLRELKTRFIASTTALPVGEDPTQRLRALEERTGALGQALEELRPSSPQRLGGRA